MIHKNGTVALSPAEIAAELTLYMDDDNRPFSRLPKLLNIVRCPRRRAVARWLGLQATALTCSLAHLLTCSLADLLACLSDPNHRHRCFCLTRGNGPFPRRLVSLSRSSPKRSGNSSARTGQRATSYTGSTPACKIPRPNENTARLERAYRGSTAPSRRPSRTRTTRLHETERQRDGDRPVHM